MSRRPVVPVDEVVCRLESGGRALRTFHCTAERYVDLGIGWLVGAGLLDADAAARARPALRRDAGVVVLSVADVRADPAPIDGRPRHAPAPDLPGAFRAMYALARRYHESGGIHAAAVVRDGAIVGFAEDVGRHNALDKAIGAAARARVPLADAGVVTSARVSGEMARKVAQSGLAWIASRSVPTTLALSIAARAGVTIVARAPAPEARTFPPRARPLGVVMAGGRNVRFGSPKALEHVGGRRIVDRVVDALRPSCEDVVMIRNDAAAYADVELEQRADDREGAGPVAGLREAVAWADERGLPGVLVVACDMPFVPNGLLEALWLAAQDADGAVPRSDGPRGVEPLCAAYRTSCRGAIERALARDDLRVVGFFDDARIVELGENEVAAHGDPARIFFNVNTREDLERAHALNDAGGADARGRGPDA